MSGGCGNWASRFRDDALGLCGVESDGCGKKIPIVPLSSEK